MTPVAAECFDAVVECSVFLLDAFVVDDCDYICFLASLWNSLTACPTTLFILYEL